MQSPVLHDVRLTSPLVDACFAARVDDHTFVRTLAQLAGQDEALVLRVGMLLAWLKRQDLLPLGYTSFGAFVSERIDWGHTWVRGMIRLIESPLDAIKKAVCAGLVPLRRAVQAPGRVAVEDQAKWLLDPEPDPDDERPRTERVFDEDADIVVRARQVARIFLGHAASNRTIDEYILQSWRDLTPAATLLAAARARPARPVWDTPLTWDWLDGDPAEALLGRWREPLSLDEALAAIDGIQAIRRGRVAVLAKVWVEVCADQRWASLGYESRNAFAREVCGWSPRTAARYTKLAWGLEWYPELDAAIAEALDLDKAVSLASVVTDRSVNRWIALARRVGRLELQRAVAEPGNLARYERAIALADEWDLPSADGRVAPLRVALPAEEPPSPPEGLRVHPDLPAAARWFVENVQIPPQHGYQKVKLRDRFVCQNPECRRISLRNEGHHVQMRSLGGSDDPANVLTVCRPCHVRGLHAGEGHIGGISVRTVELAGGVPARLWTWPDGRGTLQFLVAP